MEISQKPPTGKVGEPVIRLQQIPEVMEVKVMWSHILSDASLSRTGDTLITLPYIHIIIVRYKDREFDTV